MFDHWMFTTMGRYKPLLISNKQYIYVQVVFIYALNDCSVYTRCKNVWQDAGSGNIGWFLWWLLLSFIIFLNYWFLRMNRNLYMYIYPFIKIERKTSLYPIFAPSWPRQIIVGLCSKVSILSVKLGSSNDLLSTEHW